MWQNIEVCEVVSQLLVNTVGFLSMLLVTVSLSSLKCPSTDLPNISTSVLSIKIVEVLPTRLEFDHGPIITVLSTKWLIEQQILLWTRIEVFKLELNLAEW
uniref:Uncharacterized protein n=1 Tax=Globisporangium ultimum (strain ATCC 200006 / CBS 805.95 / DAOM BR144) TaxID=431595 RepID=K3WFQ5_GLOUD